MPPVPTDRALVELPLIVCPPPLHFLISIQHLLCRRHFGSVGVFDAADINYATEYLAKLVKENNLTPKVFVIHRFTQNGVTNYKQIKLRPEVQVVMDMDGWGHPPLKIGTYKNFIHKEPVEYTGFKIFYKNDMKNNGRLLTPSEVLALKPQPVYIQYQ